MPDELPNHIIDTTNCSWGGAMRYNAILHRQLQKMMTGSVPHQFIITGAPNNNDINMKKQSFELFFYDNI